MTVTGKVLQIWSCDYGDSFTNISTYKNTFLAEKYHCGDGAKDEYGGYLKLRNFYIKILHNFSSLTSERTSLFTWNNQDERMCPMFFTAYFDSGFISILIFILYSTSPAIYYLNPRDSSHRQQAMNKHNMTVKMPAVLPSPEQGIVSWTD